MQLQNLQADFAELLYSDQQSDLIIPACHIEIYKNNMMTALRRALRDYYPLIASLLGEECFHSAAKIYIERYPSRSGNLSDYGEYFSDFLIDFAPTNHLAYLPEVATYEWICHQLYFAAEHPPLNIQTLHAVTAETFDQLFFTLHPACQIAMFHYPIIEIIEICKGKLDHLDLESPHLQTETYLLLMRQQDHIIFETLTAGEFTFLQALQEHQTLADALTITLAVESTFNLEVKLPQWVRDKVIVDFPN